MSYCCLTQVLVGLLAATVASEASARGGGARVHYPGAQHSISHGGHYSSGKGASHKGGSYRNTTTGNRYGRPR